jgi:cell volume regulation protein A
LLHVSVPAKAKRRIGTDFELTDNLKSELQQLVLGENAYAIGKRIVQLAIPPTVNILAVKRGDMYIAPNGSTMLQANDVIAVLAEDKKSLDLLKQALGTTETIASTETGAT